MTMPLAVSNARTPARFRLSQTVLMRSVSLTRSSPASLISMPVSVAAPSTASTGISSMSAAVSAPSTTPPLRSECSTTISPINSPLTLSSDGMRMRAPMPVRKSRSAERGGLRPTPRIESSEQGDLGMIARADRLDHGGFAIGEEAGEQDAGLHLSARHGQRVLDGPQMRAVNLEGRKFAVARFDPSAHGGERGDDALHGAARK